MNITDIDDCNRCGNRCKIEKQTDADGEGETVYRICMNCEARYEMEASNEQGNGSKDGETGVLALAAPEVRE